MHCITRRKPHVRSGPAAVAPVPSALSPAQRVRCCGSRPQPSRQGRGSVARRGGPLRGRRSGPLRVPCAPLRSRAPAALVRGGFPRPAVSSSRRCPVSLRLASLVSLLCWLASFGLLLLPLPWPPCLVPAAAALAAGGLACSARALVRFLLVPAFLRWFGPRWPCSFGAAPGGALPRARCPGLFWAPAGSFPPLWRGRVLVVVSRGAWSPVVWSVVPGAWWPWRARFRAARAGLAWWAAGPGWRPVVAWRRWRWRRRVR